MKVFISFGQDHFHEVNGSIFDCDCLCQIEAPSHGEARAKAVEAFGLKFCTSYEEGRTPDKFFEYFHRGIIPLEGGL